MSELVWLDIETTGLDPRKHGILEIAVKIATGGLTDPFYTCLLFDSPIYFPYDAHFHLDKEAYGMHSKNGLLTACANSSTSCDVKLAEEQILDVLCEFVDLNDNKLILAGSSIHFDRSFINSYMPKLAKRFSNRHYDISALELFCQSCGMDPISFEKKHRALPDIENSIYTAQLCKKWLMENK